MAQARECFGSHARIVAIEAQHEHAYGTDDLADLFAEAGKYIRYAKVDYVHAVVLDFSDDIGFNLILTVE